MSTADPPRSLLHAMFRSALAAVSAERCLPAFLPPAPKGRTLVVAVGKAAATMARVAARAMPGEVSGFALTRDGHGETGMTVPAIEQIEAGHPVPDARGRAAAERILATAAALGPDDLLLALISGGASALLALPVAGVTLDEKAQVTRALLASGASIGEMNVVRRHLSRVKGGRLAAATCARVVTLVISDVPGDDP